MIKRKNPRHTWAAGVRTNTSTHDAQILHISELNPWYQWAVGVRTNTHIWRTNTHIWRTNTPHRAKPLVSVGVEVRTNTHMGDKFYAYGAQIWRTNTPHMTHKYPTYDAQIPHILRAKPLVSVGCRGSQSLR